MNKASISVCMLSNLYPPVVSGSSTQSASLGRELARRGCQTVVITAKVTQESREYEEVDGVHVYRLPAIRLPKMPISLNFPWLTYTFTPRNLRRIEAIIRRHNPDILHLHNHMFDLALSAVLMRRRNKKPLVITIHTVIKHARNFYNLLLYPADRLFLKYFVINQADALICPDFNAEDYVRNAFGKSDAALVPYGISLPETPVDPLTDRIKARYGLNGKRAILSLGHVHALRNRKDLIEALPDVLRVFPNTVLLIVGAVADDSPAVLARKLRVHESVIFAGHVPHSEVPAFLALADLEAHWLNQDAAQKTSLGIASLEAMAAGKVVLAAANENTYGPGVLRTGENIVLIDPGNPGQLAQTIIALLGDHERRRAIGERARQTVQEHFSWDSVCSRTLDLYREVLRKRALVTDHPAKNRVQIRHWLGIRTDGGEKKSMRELGRFLIPLKRFLRKAANFAVGFAAGPFAPVLAPIVSLMARTGAGTDACLRQGCLPMPVHYYSPVPDLADLERREVWARRSDLVGIDFRSDAQVVLLSKLGQQFGHECDWSLNPTGDPYQFYTENPNFSYGCAASTHCILRHFKPRHVIEIGSGNSSLVIAAALLLNDKDSAAAEYAIIDPYPRPIIKQGLPGLTRLVNQRVELLDVDFFERLGENDVLFIDSGHTVRIGGDVNYLILDVLPRLAPGVIVHFHDIPLPREYSKVYATNPHFRMFWTEAYLLQAFLCFNDRFEVLLAMSYLTAERKEELLAAFPLYDPARHLLTSGSFWIRSK